MANSNRTAASGYRPPEHIDAYHILGRLGEGGMGVVYEAEEKGAVRRRVAIKIVQARDVSPDVRARFEAERQALALMDHVGIAKVLHAGETPDGDPYFVMELVKGLPLTEYCDSRRLTIAERLRLVVAICHAMQHAHQKGVIHRDLKPSNILVTEQDGAPQPKIIDFGIAKATGQQLTDRTLVTTAGMAIGTAAYMSPEQAESSGLDVDTRADIYSLGVILYELLVGRLPVDPTSLGVHAFMVRLAAREAVAERPSATFSALGEQQAFVARTRRIDPEQLKRELRGDLDWIVMKALDPERSRRYETANGLAADLERFLASVPVIARPPTARYRMGKFVRRHRTGVGMSALGVLLLLGTTVVAVRGYLRASEAEQRAAAEAAAATEVADYLVNLFRVADPGRDGGGRVTARELLEEGARRASRDLAAQPELRARLVHTIGLAYGSLGLYDESREQLAQALAARQAVFGADDPAVAESHVALGNTASMRGDLPEAEAHLARARAIWTAARGERSVEVADVLSGLAATRWKQGRYAEADSLYRQALAIEEPAFGGEHDRVARELCGIGVAQWSLGRLADARAAMERCLGIKERALGAEHLDVASVLNNLGTIAWSEQRYDAALALYERTERIYQAVLPADHPKMGAVVNNIGETLWKLGRVTEAEPLLRRALAIKEARLAPEHQSIAVTLHALAGVQRDAGRPLDAEANYRRALGIRERALGPEDANTRETASALALLLRETGREREAAALEARFAGG